MSSPESSGKFDEDLASQRDSLQGAFNSSNGLESVVSASEVTTTGNGASYNSVKHEFHTGHGRESAGNGSMEVHLSKESTPLSETLTVAPITGAPGILTSTGREDGRRSLSVRASKKELYLDPTPKTPGTSFPPSRTPSSAGSSPPHELTVDRSVGSQAKHAHASRDADRKETRAETLAGDTARGSKSEIQSIMDQFDNDSNAQSKDINISGHLLESSMQHPPRTSSLEPIKSSSGFSSCNSPPTVSSYTADLAELQETQDIKSTPLDSPKNTSLSQPARFDKPTPNTPASPSSSSSLGKPLPPKPDPEPDLPFDFHRFLEQLRHRTADPVAKFLRSFLVEFSKKQWMVHEQEKLISDFLSFITNKMAQCDVWRGVSDAEFDNAKEGMEKLVMNRLYSQTFSPAIPLPVFVPGSKGKRKNLEKPGRRGQHQEDIERDEILGQKVRIYGWVEEEHLDITPVGDSGRRFLALAQQELLKIKTYRAPRDKVICVLNCCKVIFGLLRNSKAADTSADSFVPLLIYVVLHANPEHLVSNVQYILRFRNQEKLGGEAGYYLSSLMGAIQFIENLDRTSLTISDADFERNVEAAVFAIAERHKEETPLPPQHPVSEKPGHSEPEIVPGNSIESEYTDHAPAPSSRSGLHIRDGSDESTAANGLLRTIQKPLSSIGRIFSEEASQAQPANTRNLPVVPPPPSPPPRLSPAVFQPPRSSDDIGASIEGSRGNEKLKHSQVNRLTVEESAARQASAEAAEALRIQRVEHDDVVETLASIFPDLDKDIIDDVVRMKQGRVGSAVDACLALSL